MPFLPVAVDSRCRVTLVKLNQSNEQGYPTGVSVMIGPSLSLTVVFYLGIF